VAHRLVHRATPASDFADSIIDKVKPQQFKLNSQFGVNGALIKFRILIFLLNIARIGSLSVACSIRARSRFRSLANEGIEFAGADPFSHINVICAFTAMV
jgi:hypothetical protein